MAGSNTVGDVVDLDAYFARIGYTGAREPTLPVLQAIQYLHPLAIAFENLDPLLQRPVRLDLPSLQAKLVHGGRGGYCFEHNLLFLGVLEQLGFRASGLAARVLWNQSEDAITTRTHMLIRVELDGATWLTDVGFGAATLTGPLLLSAGIEQATPHEPFRLIAIPDGYKMQARLGGEWRTLYRFDLQQQFPIDYEPPNHYVSTNAKSHFTFALMAARPVPDGRYGIYNGELVFHPREGSSERRKLTGVEEVEAVLTQRLGITLPEPERLRETLRRLMNLR
jgi:N-hydroxyarylamine O-acetyltransferase